MKYLHTMVRVSDIDESLDFYCNKLGMKETRRMDSEQGRFTLIYLAAPGDEDAELELTYNWDPEPYDEAVISDISRIKSKTSTRPATGS